MKKLIYIFLLLFACWACNDEPNFPDPGLDTTKDVRDTVRRDTINAYQLSMRVKAPNGVESIQVLDGRNYNEIASFTEEYDGKKDFVFTYDIDISDIHADTTMQFIVKVIDRNMRSYNKGFSLVIYDFSKPIITIAGTTADGRVTLPNNYMMFKARFKTGLRTIKSYKLSINNIEFDTHTYDTLMHEFIHKKGYVLEEVTEKDKDYTLKVEMTDSEGEKAVKEITVRMMDLQRPEKVILSKMSGSKWTKDREFEYHYNSVKPEQLEKIEGVRYYYDRNGKLTSSEKFTTSFTYNNQGMVTKLELKWARSDGAGRNDFMHEITYDETGEKVTGWNRTLNGLAKGIWTVSEYLEDGRIASFLRDESVQPYSWHYEDGLFAEYDLGATNDKDRIIVTGVTSWAMPTFLPGLPAIEINNSSYNSDILELLMYKNGFERVEKAGVLQSSYIYTADDQGRLQSMKCLDAKTTPSGREYLFIYND